MALVVVCLSEAARESPGYAITQEDASWIVFTLKTGTGADP
jgi:hypothetical protein